jgi:hypothetical protein
MRVRKRKKIGRERREMENVFLVKLFFKPLQGLQGRGAEPHIRKGMQSILIKLS